MMKLNIRLMALLLSAVVLLGCLAGCDLADLGLDIGGRDNVGNSDVDNNSDPSNNGESIRCVVPALTEERRRDLLKKAKAAGENAKVSVRNARRDAIELLKKANKDGMPEDLQKEYEQLVQKETDAFTKKVDELVAAKEKEMMTV